jgi:glycosyltransferase involved in cell wall biosynthesis
LFDFGLFILKKERVLLVIDSLEAGGAEQVFADIVELLFGHVSFDVLLVQPKREEAYDLPKEVRLMYLNRISKWSLQSFFRCRATINKYNIVHVHMRHTYRYISTISKTLLRPPKLILHDHSGLVSRDAHSTFRFAFLFKPDIYIGVSQLLCYWAQRTWHLEERYNYKLVNIPSSRFLNFEVNNGPQNKNGDLVMFANIKENKNQIFAREISKRLHRKLTFVGKKQDASYSNLLLNGEGSSFVEIIDDVNDVKLVLSNYKLGLFTSFYESGPLVVLEYLLCGIPFLAYKTGEVANIASRYFPEYFIDNFNIDEWCERIKVIELDYTSISGTTLSEMIQKEFNIESYRNTLLSIYEL